METINVLDKQFTVSISEEEIQQAVRKLAGKLNEDFKGEEVIFLAILNGAFMFAADLMKHIRLDCTISFVKLASYIGITSSGVVTELIGITEDLEGKNVIIIEDIIDTGKTLVKIMDLLKRAGPKTINIATLLLKPEAYNESIPLDYTGLEIPNDFVIGYGLDYNGFGRNYPFICIPKRS